MTHENPLHTFIAEARDLLRAMEDALLQIEGAPQDAGLINEIFRAAHTIKGSAGLFGLERIVAFTHVLENLLDHVRDGALALDSGRVALLLFCGDHIQQLVDHCEDGALSPATVVQGEQLLAATDWLPALMRTPKTVHESVQQEQTEAVTEADANAYADAAE